jgi:hypothetical protein
VSFIFIKSFRQHCRLSTTTRYFDCWFTRIDPWFPASKCLQCCSWSCATSATSVTANRRPAYHQHAKMVKTELSVRLLVGCTSTLQTGSGHPCPCSPNLGYGVATSLAGATMYKDERCGFHVAKQWRSINSKTLSTLISSNQLFLSHSFGPDSVPADPPLVC